MPLAAHALRMLRSLLAMVTALAVLVAGVWLSGEAAAWMDLPKGGDARLAWDLAGVTVAGIAAFATAARLAPCAAGGHALALFLLLALAASWGVVTMGGDFPLWFRAGVLLSLPLQGVAGWYVFRWLSAP